MTSAFLQSLRTDGGEPWNTWDVRDFIEKLRGKLRVETKHRYFSLFLMKISITFVSPRTAATVRWEARHQSDHSETEAHTAIFCLFWTPKSAQQKMIVVLKLNPGPHTGANIESRWQCKYTAPVVTGRLSRSHSLTSHSGEGEEGREGRGVLISLYWVELNWVCQLDDQAESLGVLLVMKVTSSQREVKGIQSLSPVLSLQDKHGWETRQDRDQYVTTLPSYLLTGRRIMSEVRDLLSMAQIATHTTQ